MKLIDIIKEDRDNREELMNYAKFVFENFLEHGSFEFGEYEFKWHVPEKNVYYSVNIDKEPRINFGLAIIYFDGDVFWDDDEKLYNKIIGGSLSQHQMEKKFYSVFKEIARYHNVDFIIDMHTIKYKQMKFYQKENLEH